KAARDIIVTLGNRLEMGRFQRLLPADVAADATLQQLNLTRFHQLYHQAVIGPRLETDEKLHLLAQ
ncbi:MAG: hypothetical protein R6X34_13390, partial [Chloroflexota bacterium]